MLVIEQDTPNSTAILSWYFQSTHETYEKGVLAVTFVGGAQYLYLGCPTRFALEMVTQASLGRYFATVVKPYFPADDVIRTENALAE
jgi:hypothetical protein